MAKRTPDLQRPIAVRIIDRTIGESYSLTVYGASALYRVARQIEFDLRNHWKTTSLSDRRHKRRL